MTIKEQLKKLIDDKIKKIRILSNTLEAEIVARTLKGKDENNKPFKKYAKSTIAIRKEKKRSRKVNLFDTGVMLGGLITVNVKGGAVIKFISNDAKNRMY